MIGARGELYRDASDRYAVTELLAQQLEAREAGDGDRHTPGVDPWGRTRADRAAWRAFRNGF